ncbi:MAG: 4-(cytidine 5'-diphospho)-2-C-methyl-D-erythritol kinase [Verrucomicrobiota bacterium]
MSENPVVLHERAPAKINVFLRVLGKREDGFHEVETLMAPIELEDEVTLKVYLHGKGRIRCKVEGMAGVPADESNLAGQAARAWLDASGARYDVEISLRKVIPAGAGLGGGSSDAAAVLRSLNGLSDGDPLSTDKLYEVGANLGSDVPFLIAGVPALCKGRGEKITPHTGSLSRWSVLLVKPPFGISTPEAYGRWKESVEIPNVDYGQQLVDGIGLVNDLERPVFEKFLVLARLKTWLREQEGVKAALMSGSGATVYAILEREGLGGELGKRVAEEFGESFWTRESRISGVSRL